MEVNSSGEQSSSFTGTLLFSLEQNKPAELQATETKENVSTIKEEPHSFCAVLLTPRDCTLVSGGCKNNETIAGTHSRLSTDRRARPFGHRSSKRLRQRLIRVHRARFVGWRKLRQYLPRSTPVFAGSNLLNRLLRRLLVRYTRRGRG